MVQRRRVGSLGQIMKASSASRSSGPARGTNTASAIGQRKPARWQMRKAG